MDYKEKYNAALEIAKECLQDGTITTIARAYIWEIFPELKEQEEENKRISKEISRFLKQNNGWNNEWLTWLERQGEQKTDKVESKFKVGDWITTTDEEGNVTTEKIIEFCGDKVRLIDTNGFYTLWPEHELNYYHLWTIADAKDGDVLYAKGRYFKEYVFKFSSFTEDNVISTHFGYDFFHGVFDTELSRFGREEELELVNPATKEQRDQLFQKMKEAGYKWDSDKKELKKYE